MKNYFKRIVFIYYLVEVMTIATTEFNYQTIVRLFLAALLFYYIYKGKNWAKTTYIVLLSICIILNIILVTIDIDVTKWVLLLTIFLYSYSIYLLTYNNQTQSLTNVKPDNKLEVKHILRGITSEHVIGYTPHNESEYPYFIRFLVYKLDSRIYNDKYVFKVYIRNLTKNEINKLFQPNKMYELEVIKDDDGRYEFITMLSDNCVDNELSDLIGSKNYSIDGLGEFEKPYNYSSAYKTVNWIESTIKVDINLDNYDNVLPQQVETLKQIFNNQDYWNNIVKETATEKMLPIYNKNWASDVEDDCLPYLTKEQFINRISISSLSIETDNSFQFELFEDYMFGGHTIFVKASLDGIIDIHI